jgi:hypothetical protein
MFHVQFSRPIAWIGRLVGAEQLVWERADFATSGTRCQRILPAPTVSGVMRGGLIRKILIVGLLTATACSTVLRVSSALADEPSASASCGAVDKTCASLDSAFVPTSITVSSSGGTTKVACTGATTNKPKKTTACSGDDKTSETQGCSITLGNQTLGTDDWTETISSSGKVKLACQFGGDSD